MKGIIKDSLILFVITLVAGLLLGGVYNVTKEPIKKQEQLTKDKAYKAVFADADTFNEYTDVNMETLLDGTDYRKNASVDSILVAMKGDEKLGYIANVVSHEGYGGDISIVVGIKLDGTVTGISILSISETPGLGMNATKPEFYEQFADKNVDKFVYTKTGKSADYEIDAISSATITSNAVTNAVNAAISAVNIVKLKAGDK